MSEEFTTPPLSKGSLFQVNNSGELTVKLHKDQIIIKAAKFAWGDTVFFLPFIAFALLFIFVGLATSTVAAYEWLIVDDEPCTFSDEDPLFSGDGTAYCQDYASTDTYLQLEISEDYLRYTNDEGATYYRWSLQGEYFVIAEIQDDGYASCSFYQPVSELPTNWSTGDLTDPYLWDATPSWCNDVGFENDDDFTSTESSPFNGERLYRVSDANYGDLSYLKFSNTTVAEANYLVDTNDGLLGVLFPLIFIGAGAFMLRGVDNFRPFRLTFNQSSESLRWHKAFAGTRFSGREWNHIDLTTLQIKRTTEEIWYSGNYDDSGYFSTKSGDLLSVVADGMEQPLVFFIGPSLDAQQDPFLVALAQAAGIDAVVRIEHQEEETINFGKILS